MRGGIEMKNKWDTKSLLIFTIVIGLLILPTFTLAKEMVQEWELINPEGVVKIEPMKINPHPTTLQGKTVVLRWNGKQNGDKFLNQVAELLAEKVKDVKIIKAYELVLQHNTISQNQDQSMQVAKEIAAMKPDIVIGSQAD
jgi:hypothetical protein